MKAKTFAYGDLYSRYEMDSLIYGHKHEVKAIILVRSTFLVGEHYSLDFSLPHCFNSEDSVAIKWASWLLHLVNFA